tara:strand:- start:82 stop:483 length:402 start_codon:yes stop_codon:yes gene_type:complete
MKATKANIVKSLPIGTKINTCDNSGAKIIRIISIKGHKTGKGKRSSAGVGDFVTASVQTGNQAMRKQKVNAIIVRQKKEYRRPNGVRVKFEDNAAIVLKDEKGAPKGTVFKGPISKEAAEKWSQIAKIASIIV